MSDTPSDVVIVGGGLCGLRLASLLQQAGREWQLLEARDRIGGRVLSPKEAGTAIDLGPAWFWPGQPRMAALAQDLGLQVFEQYATGMSRFEDAQGRIAQQSGFASMEGALRIASGMGAITDALTASLPQDRHRGEQYPGGHQHAPRGAGPAAPADGRDHLLPCPTRRDSSGDAGCSNVDGRQGQGGGAL